MSIIYSIQMPHNQLLLKKQNVLYIKDNTHKKASLILINIGLEVNGLIFGVWKDIIKVICRDLGTLIYWELIF